MRLLSNSGLTIATLGGIPQVRPGDDLAALLIAALEGDGVAPRSRDIVVVTSKIVSKAEGRFVDLAALEPSELARELAQITRKDARLVDAILREAVEVLRAKPNVLIVATRHGLDHGQRRHRSVQPRCRRPRPARAAAAGGARRQRPAPQGQARRALPGRHRRDRLRQRRPAVAARHRRPRHRRGGRALAVGPARREGPERPPAGGDRGRLRRCGGGHRGAGHGRGRRGTPGGAGARARLERQGRARPRRWCGPRPRTCSDEPAGRRARQLRRAVRRQRRRQARRRAGAAAAASGSPSSSTPATTSPIWGCTSRPTSTPCSIPWRAWSTRRPAGAGARRRGPSCARWARSAGRPGSSWATAISPRTSTARGRLRAGETLTGVAARQASALGVTARILPMTDDPVAHGGGDRCGHAELPGILRARPVPAGGARHPLRRRRRGAAHPPGDRGAVGAGPRRHRHRPVEPVAQRRSDPGRARPARGPARPAARRSSPCRPSSAARR